MSENRLSPGSLKAFGVPDAVDRPVMNIWGYSEDSLVELAIANPSALQQLHSLLTKMEQSASRDDLSTYAGCTAPMSCDTTPESWVTLV